MARCPPQTAGGMSRKNRNGSKFLRTQKYVYFSELEPMLKRYKCTFILNDPDLGEQVRGVKRLYADNVEQAGQLAESIAEHDKTQWKCRIPFDRIDVVEDGV